MSAVSQVKNSNKTHHKFDIPQNSIIKESFTYGYKYIYVNHVHLITAYNTKGMQWWKYPE